MNIVSGSSQIKLLIALATSCLLISCAADKPNSHVANLMKHSLQAISLLGDSLFPPALPDSTLTARSGEMFEAANAFMATPEEVDAAIWYGRRTAYLGLYREAISIYTEGLEKSPGEAKLLRHRGHRFISIREFDLAVDDLAEAATLIKGKADEVEADGLPNALNIPTSTLQSNIWYHLGLAYYLQGNYEAALPAYQACLEVSNNPDMMVATVNWLYVTQMHLGRTAAAAKLLDSISPEMKIIENKDYLNLLLLYKAQLTPEALVSGESDGVSGATIAYGVANWHLLHGREQAAVTLFRQICATNQWAAFGFIAAEAELARRADLGHTPAIRERFHTLR